MALASRGHQVHFITYRRPARLTHFQENVYFHEVSTYEYPLFEFTPYDTVLASKLVDVVLYEKLDLLHVHYAIPHAAVAYLAKMILKSKNIYVPTVTTLHGTDITLVGNDASFAPVVEFSINQSDGVTAVSRQLKEQTEKVFRLTRDIRVIYNFIDFSRFRKVNKQHFRKAIAPDGEKLLLHTSNFRKVKRIHDVIYVFEKVSKEIPSKLLMIGDGPERLHAEELCRKLDICGEVRFLGKQDAIEELLAVSDLFILPSEHESFGLAALEAMACEVPVISSNAGGLPEVNLHGVTGFLSNVGDIEDMAANAIRLLKDEDMLARFSQAALARAKEYDIDNIVPHYEQYYEEVLEQSKNGTQVTSDAVIGGGNQ
jgi:N-acetyl-alpha-D-glucosaminyl L-malate synthase BshA